METHQTGGKLLDHGAYSCVFMPPLLCKGHKPGDKKSDAAKKELKLTKLISKSFAENEYSIASNVRKIPLWKNYFVVAESICTPAPLAKQKDKDIKNCPTLTSKNMDDYRLLRLTYGGIPISMYRMELKDETFYKFVRHLMEGAALMTLFGVVHSDMHRGNILVLNNTPRIIDFNISTNANDFRDPDKLIDIDSKIMIPTFEPSLVQEPPDSSLIAGLIEGYYPDTVINDIMAKKFILKKIQALLGVTATQQRKDLLTFYEKSKAAQNADYVSWFKTYWRTIDSWAVGCNIVILIQQQMLWPAFVSGDYARYSAKLLHILNKMCEVNPMNRIDNVQALAMLEPDNYIIKTYASAWLSKVGLPA